MHCKFQGGGCRTAEKSLDNDRVGNEDPEPMLHVQQILTEWSNIDESDELESKRTAIPDVMRVPYFDAKIENVWHRVRHRQSENYLCTEMVGDLSMGVSIRLGSILLSPHPGIVLVDFVWSEETTWRPKRDSCRGIRLRPEEWGQVKYNGWLPDSSRENGKKYQQLVFNILFEAKLTSEGFLESEPTQVFEQTIDLNTEE